MDYQNTLKYLYESAPMFQQIGGKAYKPGLETTHKLDEHFGHPHQQFKTIHIAGTNGKGSCSHTIAAVLQCAGYRVGLFTSPHLIDFRERIRINGEMIPEEYVVNFVEEHRSFFEPLHPSFFELTTAMAFRYFADQKVDVAVIEVGMGGRLDCTNIIHPDLCVITNIGLDHTQYLGDTLTKIAKEKAGIIKEGVPVVIGRAQGAVKRVFTMKAKEKNAPIEYARENARYWDMEIVPYSKLQEIRPMMDNTIQSMHEMIEAMDEQSEEEANQMRQALLMLDLSDSLRTLDQILDKEKMLSKSTMRCSFRTFHRVERSLPIRKYVYHPKSSCDTDPSELQHQIPGLSRRSCKRMSAHRSDGALAESTQLSGYYL